MEQPTLCEPGVRYFIGCSLKESRKFKDKYINLFFNIFMACLLIVTVTIVLVFRYKGRLTTQETKLKNKKKEDYIISKLQYLAAIKENNNKNMITNLPTWSNNPEIQMLRSHL